MTRQMGITDDAAAVKLDAFTALYDAGTTNPTGYVVIYDGTRPASVKDAVTTQNALIRFDNTSGAQSPMFGPAVPSTTVARAKVFGAPWLANAIASGDASWARAYDRDDKAVSDGNVGAAGSGSDFEMSSTAVTVGSPYTLDWTLEELALAPAS